jgi:putative acetyltransferase
MIRHARAADRPAIAEINTLAFGQPDEAALVQRLRDAGDVLFELVSETDGQVDGHILFSRLWADRPELYAALAPMAVHPDRQRSGTGAALIRAGIATCREVGARGILVLGHRDYYPRLGFAAETAAKVKSPYSGSPSFMALAIEDGAFDEPLTVVYSDAFSG